MEFKSASDETLQTATGRLSRRNFLVSSAVVGLGVTGAGTLLAACGGSDQGAGAVAKALRIQLDADISNLDPAINPGHTDTEVATNIFENLVVYRPDSFELVNELAEKFEPSSDGLRYDFTLRKGVQFHGGYGEVTADDVKFSYERIAGLTDPPIKSSYKSDWKALKSVEVRDRYSGTIVLKEPFAALMTTTLPYGSGQIVSKKAVTERGDKFGTNPIGTGPYEFVEWKRNEQVTLKKFAKYSGAAGYLPAPQWDELRFTIIPEANSAAVALQTGELDFATLSPDTLARIKNDNRFTVTQRTTLKYSWVGINTAHPNFRDRNVRLAVVNGIDVPAIVEAAFDGQWTRATGLIAPGMPVGYWKDAPVQNRDVAKAKAYLSQAGAVGRKVTMQVASGKVGAEKVAQIVQQNLNEVGFHVDVDVQEKGVFNQATPEANKQKQLFYQSFSTKPDPSWSTTWFTCDQVGVWNWMSWCNPRYTDLHNKALIETDPAKRNQMYIQMQQIMNDDAVAVWIAWPTAFLASRAQITPAIRPEGEFIPWAFTPAKA